MKNKIFKCSVDVTTIENREVVELTGEFMLCKTPSEKTRKEYYERYTDKSGAKDWWNTCKNKDTKWLNGKISPWFDGEWEDFYSDVDSLPETPNDCVSMGRVSKDYNTPYLHKGTFSESEYPCPVWVLVNIIEKPIKFTYRELKDK